MNGQNKNNKGNTGRKRILLPVFSAVLVLCYIAALAWHFIFGFGNAQEAEEVTDSPVIPTYTVSPPGTSPTFSMAPSTPAEVEEPVIEMPPAVQVRGLYIAAWFAAMEDRMAHYIEICETTEINALVIDVKDEAGNISFITGAESLSEASMNIIPDIERLVATLKNHGVYTIARIVCFNDPLWSSRRPELAIHTTTGGVWKDVNGSSWLDPYNTAAWDYIAAVSLEAVRVGFDEIQLDYVRFPTDGRLQDIDYGAGAAERSKTEVISDFVSYIREVLAKEGVRLSADVFGIIAISDNDADSIGQDLSLLLHDADYLCPMIYPSHFANKRQNGTGQRINGVLFEAPDLYPYEVVYNILIELSRHLDEEGGQAIIRPYLQDFTASYLGQGYYMVYTAQQVRDQIQAVYDAGFDEWILWNHYSEYNDDTFLPPGGIAEAPETEDEG